MTNFLDRLVARSRGETAVLRPLAPTRFGPDADAPAPETRPRAPLQDDAAPARGPRDDAANPPAAPVPRAIASAQPNEMFRVEAPPLTPATAPHERARPERPPRPMSAEVHSRRHAPANDIVAADASAVAHSGPAATGAPAAPDIAPETPPGVASTIARATLAPDQAPAAARPTAPEPEPAPVVAALSVNSTSADKTPAPAQPRAAMSEAIPDPDPATAPPRVTIEIGSIEFRAPEPAAPQATPVPRRPRVTLDDYLARRGGRG